MFRNIIFIVIVAALVAGHFLYSVLRVPDQRGVVEIEIQRGRSFDQIVKDLSDAELLRHERYFKTLAIILGRDKELKAGSYAIPKNTSVYQLVKIITESNGAFRTTITIPEGFNLKNIDERISSIVERPVLISAIKVEDFAKQFSFLSSVPLGSSLEGYLFPDTYTIDRYDSDHQLAKRMLENFRQKLTQELQEEIKKQGKTLHEIITTASLIEKEIPARFEEDRQVASGVLWKRLKAGVPLQVDATVVYATGKNGQRVTYSDLEVDSLYNTYKYRGLPPGPIANPGLGAIKAAIYPKDSPYWYYLSKPTGETVFSKTLEEHNEARARYLQ